MKLNKNFSRRKFIADGLLAGAGLSLLPIVSKGDFSSSTYQTDERILSGFNLDPIVPIQYFNNYHAELVQYLREIRYSYGIRRFLIVGPSKEYRYLGFPDKAVFEKIGYTIRRLKEQLSGHDIEIGWWCTTTIRIGKGAFQQIVKADGQVVEEAVCPADPGFRETFSSYVSSVVKIAQPFWVNFEDDFHLNGGCFCSRCLHRFTEKTGEQLNREEIRQRLGLRGKEASVFTESWLAVGREALVGLAEAVRKQVDLVAPDTRLCLCQSGSSERDGNFTEAVTLAFAGQTRPAVRVFGSSYFSDNPMDIPASLFNAVYQRQHLPAEVEMIHESDTFPHTRFFMSASKLRSLMTVSFAYGLDGSLFYATQYLENPMEEKGYLDMYLRENKRFSRLMHEVKGCALGGCQIFRKPRQSANWAQIAGRLGIPYTTAEAKVKLLTADSIEDLNDAELVGLLKGSILLDGSAAFVILSRGLGHLIGTSVRLRDSKAVPPFYEGVRDPESLNLGNRLMYNYVWAFGSTNNSYYHLEPLEGALVLTDLMNDRNEPVSAGMLLFKNEFGGRIATLAYNVNDSYVHTRSIAMFNYSRKQLLRYAIEWVGEEELPAFVSSLPNVFCVFTRSSTANYSIVTLIGLSSDDYPEVHLDLSAEWVDSKVSLLREDGYWSAVPVDYVGRTMKLSLQLSLMQPLILRLDRA